MTRLATAAAILAATTTAATAGGLDRSGQSVGVIFKDGNWAELSFGNVNPSVSGIYTGAGNVSSGDMADSYNQLGGAVKFDTGNGLGAALIFDQPWGAATNYANSALPPTNGVRAELNSVGITALASYDVTDRITLYGGVRQNTIDMSISLPAVNPPFAVAAVPAYTATGASSSAMGYVVGAAYEIPDIALRAAITYSSETNHDVVTTESGAGVSTTRITMPKSVNLDFQTGIAADTLLTAGVRWVNWTATAIDPAGHRAQRGAALQTYSEDSYTWSLGVGRRFSENFAGSATVSWERPQGGNSGNLAPTDGFVSLSLGGAYTMDNMEISGGVRYVKIGDATTSTAGAVFSGNSAVAIGMKVGFSF